jgi:hypothetical protein
LEVLSVDEQGATRIVRKQRSQRRREVGRRRVPGHGSEDLGGRPYALDLELKTVGLAGRQSLHHQPTGVDQTHGLRQWQKLRTAASVRRISNATVSLEERLHVVAGAREPLAEGHGAELDAPGLLARRARDVAESALDIGFLPRLGLGGRENNDIGLAALHGQVSG